MRAFPEGGLIGRTVRLVRGVRALQIPLYAANACYFIVLAVFPALLLLLGLLRFTPLETQRLPALLQGILPGVLLAPAQELILLVYGKVSGSELGISAVAALWSASRGIYGLLRGLNAIYGVEEDRGYVYARFISVLYTFAFLLVLVLTLSLQVFGRGLSRLLSMASAPFLRFLGDILSLRFFLLAVLQTGVFTAIYTVLPNRRSRLREGLPGALLASCGWLIFSNLYSVYVEHFAHLTNVYGSVYAVALSMVWLYCCISIVFYGGALNRHLSAG